MTARTLTLHHQTRIAVSVIIEDDSGVLIYTIFLITRLFTLLRRTGQLVAAILSELSLLMIDLKAALNFTAKVLVIGFNSLAYGLGVTL
jgi:hypothetical protein